jgi:hypothetical protein
MSREVLPATPDATPDASFNEGFSDIDMQLLQAHNQLAQQVEVLSYDPSLSAEKQEEKNEAIAQAVGAIGLAAEGLDYDTLKHQTEVNEYRAYVSEEIRQQSTKNFGNLKNELLDDEDDQPAYSQPRSRAAAH